MTILGTAPRPAANLEFPMSLGRYDSYVQAQRVVGQLSDNGFPVEHIAIVGTGLKSVERVTGRLTRGRFAAAGALSGLWMGLFVGVTFAVFGLHGPLGLITTPLLGALFGLIWSQLGFSAVTLRGAWDFSSVTRVEASEYDVMVEHTLAAHARQVLFPMSAA